MREDELEVLFPLMRARLEMSVAMAARQHAAAPDNDYLLVSQAGVREVLERLEGEDATLAHFRFRDACGYEASPRARGVRQFLATHARAPGDGGRPGERAACSTSARGMPPVDGLAIGRYDEERSIYTAPEFQTPDGRWRTRHMAVDVFAPAGDAGVRAVRRRSSVRENRDRLGRLRRAARARATTASGRCTGISIPIVARGGRGARG